MVVPDTGVQEKAGLVVSIVVPLAGAAMTGTEATPGLTVKLRTSDQALVNGAVANTTQ
jgi:hypothetical protein